MLPYYCRPPTPRHILGECLTPGSPVVGWITLMANKPVYPLYLLNCTGHHCTALYCTALRITAQRRTALNCTTLYYNALHCTALNCTTLHCTAYHCTELNCISKHCNAMLQWKYSTFCEKCSLFVALFPAPGLH